MIKVTFACLLFLALSCSSPHNDFPTTPSKWIVKEIKTNTKNTSIYLVEPIEKEDLNMRYTWMVDSIGKFNAGDTLSFQISH
jgi:hypothetical protein